TAPGRGPRHAADRRAGRRGRAGRPGRVRRRRQRLGPGHRDRAHQLPHRRRRALSALRPPGGALVPRHTFELNGETVTVDAPDDANLLWVLRDVLGVTGPKYGCGVGVCKACTSHLDGAAFQPCTMTVAECAGRSVTTIEGLADGDRLHPVQQAWIDEDVAQCGYCQP